MFSRALPQKGFHLELEDFRERERREGNDRILGLFFLAFSELLLAAAFCDFVLLISVVWLDWTLKARVLWVQIWRLERCS